MYNSRKPVVTNGLHNFVLVLLHSKKRLLPFKQDQMSKEDLLPHTINVVFRWNVTRESGSWSANLSSVPDGSSLTCITPRNAAGLINKS